MVILNFKTWRDLKKSKDLMYLGLTEGYQIAQNSSFWIFLFLNKAIGGNK